MWPFSHITAHYNRLQPNISYAAHGGSHHLKASRSLLPGCLSATMISMVGCSNPSVPELAPRTVKPPPSSLLGCWSFVPQRWTSAYLPAGFIAELTDSALALPTADTRYSIRGRAPGADSLRWRMSSWALFAVTDSIYIGLGDGFNGIALRLLPGPDQILGAGTSYTDAPGFHRGGPVRGSRIACP
jgi:hypothetical protein